MTLELRASALATGTILGIIIGSSVGVYAVFRGGGILAQRPALVSPESAEAIKKWVYAAYSNEHFHPDPSGTCWYPGSPAQLDVKERLPELERLARMASSHLEERPHVEYVKVYSDEYAEVATTEQRFFPRTEVSGNRTTEVGEFSRVYRLKQVGITWQVYQLTPLPIAE